MSIALLPPQTAAIQNYPSSKVLATYELLEQILQHLDCATLLRDIRLVCKHWKTLVDDSPVLQWHTWHWKGLKPPLAILQDDPSLRRDITNPFGYELSEDAMLWMRFFWLCLMECMENPVLRHDVETIGGTEDERSTWDSIINVLPRLELFRPRFVNTALVRFKFYKPLDDLVDAILAEEQVEMKGEELQLRNFARLIMETAFAEEEMWLGPEVWDIPGRSERGVEVDSEGRRIRASKKTLNVSIIVDFTDPVKECTGSMTTTMRFEFNEPDLKKIDIEYWFPEGDCKVYELQLYKKGPAGPHDTPAEIDTAIQAGEDPVLAGEYQHLGSIIT
ncbi:hypothetical protein H072_1449 [Dactylellina haptotyla CBS 200.50]|uniref:F-box domain-containing protein n=1 Tax=Dactylellina haptotyla (strain CBS 200.50) TaxID=1284197 RepID=S8AU96_DACHA|nr:hypothetical protein H072_1449 [Dactylellina haptotyla CBS 200.50]